MKITTVLFDLDGTLLPMDMDVFIKAYFGGLAEYLAPYGYEPKRLFEVIWRGTGKMIKNDGSCKNADRFWQSFTEAYGEEARLRDEHHIDRFYEEKFNEVSRSCGFTPEAAATVRKIKEMGLRVALATNPVFPRVATEKRIAWTGLSPDEFELFTAFENSSFCKPNPDYYREVIEKLGVSAEECLMVGNDVSDDGAAGALGMRVFFLTDCLINKDGVDISAYPHGSFADLLRYISENA